MNLAGISSAILATVTLVSAKVFLSESFNDDTWKSLWIVPSKNTNPLGAWEVSSGKFHADARVSRGLRTLDDMHLYAITAPLSGPVSNGNGDFIVQFSAKNEQNLNCGGAYIKVTAIVFSLTNDIDILSLGAVR